MKRPLLLALHKYIGLITGVFFLITAVTGGLLLYKEAILYAWYPELAEARQGAEEATGAERDALLATFWARHEHKPLRSVFYPNDKWPFYTATYLDGETAYFSARDGEIVSTRGYENPVVLLFDIHHDWLMDEAGELASGYVHLAVLLLLALGIYAWWPRSWSKSLHLVLKGSAIKVNYSWHRVVGAVSSLVLIVAVATGVMMVFYTQVQSVLVATFGGDTSLPSRAVEAGEQWQPWQNVQEVISETLPEGDVRLVVFPADAESALAVRKRMPDEWHQNGRSFIHINPYTAEVTFARDDREQELGLRLTHKIYPLHSAGVGGTPYTLLLAIAGFAPLILVPTGFYVWWWRRKRRARREQATEDKPAATTI